MNNGLKLSGDALQVVNRRKAGAGTMAFPNYPFITGSRSLGMKL